MIFRGGSGSGINLSNIRGSVEHLSKGGLASGPVSFMRGADAWAGTIKSGGKTRRAAKMVVLDVDHPDIEDFIWCKANEEKKAAALRDAGFDMSIDGEGFSSIQYQNANNSVRVTDEFMQAVADDADWDLIARNGGETTKTLPARDLLQPDRRRRLAVRRSGRPVRLDHQPLAHLPGVGADQRLEPVLGVHARRQLGLQSRLAEPDEVPPRGRQLRQRRLRALRRRRLLGSGDRRRPVELSDAGDRRQRARLPPARARLRQPRRPTDVQRPALRLRRGAQRRRRDHRADDRSRLPQVSRDRGRGRHLRRVREEPRGAQRRDADASRRLATRSTRRLVKGGAARGGAAQLGRGGRARRRARLPQRPGDGARPHRDDQLPDGLRHDRASSPTSRWSSSRSWSAAAR